MPRPVIQDIAVVGSTTLGGDYAVGEAYSNGDLIPTESMTQEERQKMLVRLDSAIGELMGVAQQTYQSNCYMPETGAINGDYITRLSTNEFFFYTKEPLTLEEFQVLQNLIAEKAKKLSPGVQLILGSFAVLTDDDKVMNITPHITCGPDPEFNFIIKSNTSDIDVRYKTPVDGDVLGVLDAKDGLDFLFVPDLIVNGKAQGFNFKNVIESMTPGGTKFLTAVDVCLDHHCKVAEAFFKDLVSLDPSKSTLPLSYVVISNWTELDAQMSNIPGLMHVDPYNSLKQCKQGISQNVTEFTTSPNSFGEGRFNFFVCESDLCHVLAMGEAPPGKAIMSSILGLINGVHILSQSPFTIQFQDPLVYLCLKKYLDKNVIPYSETSQGQIELPDSFFLQQYQQMTYMLASDYERNMLVTEVKSDIIRHRMASLLATIDSISVDENTDFPVFYFQTKESAARFVATFQYYSNENQCTNPQVHGGNYAVVCRPEHFLDETFYNNLVEHYQKNLFTVGSSLGSGYDQGDNNAFKDEYQKWLLQQKQQQGQQNGIDDPFSDEYATTSNPDFIIKRQ